MSCVPNSVQCLKNEGLKKDSGEAWEQVKETAEKIWEGNKTGVADAHSKFK